MAELIARVIEEEKLRRQWDGLYRLIAALERRGEKAAVSEIIQRMRKHPDMTTSVFIGGALTTLELA